MRFQFKVKLFDAEPETVTTTFMDVVMAERHFGMSATMLDSVEHMAFLAHSAAKVASRGTGNTVAPFDEWLLQLEELEELATEDLEDLAGKSEEASTEADDSPSVAVPEPTSLPSASNSTASLSTF